MLPDAKTVVASFFNGIDYKTLCAEDITTGNKSQVGTHSGNISTVLYDEASRTLFAGDNSGYVIQYQKSEDSASFSQLKNYWNVGIGYLYSSTLVKNLAIFGGNNNRIIAIDIDSKQVLPGSVITSFQCIRTLTPCEVSRSRTLLSVGGSRVNYSDTRTHIFEVWFDDNEDESVSTTSASSQLSPDTMTFPGVHSQDLVNVIISGLKGYVKELFSDFTRVYLGKLNELQGKCY